MSRKRSLAVCAITALIVSIVAAASASAALPELGRCVRAEGGPGQYKAAMCIATSPKGKFNWLPGPGANRKFSGSGEGTALETVGKRKIECGGSTFEGEYTGPKTETVTVDLIGCDESAGKRSCQSNPAREGEIETQPLEGELGFIKGGEKPVVGLDLKHEGPLFNFECGKPPESVITGVVEGSVIAQVLSSSLSNVNKMSDTSFLKYKAVGGKQNPDRFEGGPKDTMTVTLLSGAGTSVEEIGLRAVVENLGEEPLEIKAK